MGYRLLWVKASVTYPDLDKELNRKTILRCDMYAQKPSNKKNIEQEIKWKYKVYAISGLTCPKWLIH